jgi:hypothetical protein
MNANRRAMALVILDLISGKESDEALAERSGDYPAVAAGAAYLAGFAVEALALQRRESVPTTVAFLSTTLGDDADDADGGDDLGGVREARRPRPSPDGATAQTDSL